MAANIEDLIEQLKSTNHICEMKRVSDVSYKTPRGKVKPVCSIFLDDKYIQFHDEFTQIGMAVPGMKAFMEESGWNNNHT